MQVMFFLTGRFMVRCASLVIVGFRHIHGTRNIPFRGHRDDSSQYSTQDSGNFQALLDFRVRSGDQVLADHFKNAPRNATYRSKTTQNELISCCAQILNKKIIKEIKVSRFFPILADEVTDCSNKEQMPLVIKYVDSSQKANFRHFSHVFLNFPRLMSLLPQSGSMSH